MSFIKEYREYLKDNPQGYWFKRKLYGWGWTPARWEGWTVLVVFLIYFVWAMKDLALALEKSPVVDGELTQLVVKIVIALIVLMVICYWKGETPKWQWGITKNK